MTKFNQHNMFPLSKTLKFELKPIGETKSKIKEFISNDKNTLQEDGGLSGKDVELAKKFKIVKKLLNEMHKVFIEEALAFSNIEQIDKSIIEELYSAWKEHIKNKKDKKAEENLEKKQKEVATIIGHSFDKKAEDWKKNTDKKIKENKIKALCGGKGAIILLKEKLENDQLNLDNFNETKKDLLKMVEDFKGFSTYFTGFNKNRKNIYNIKDFKVSSVAHRLLKDNLSRFFVNINKWKKTSKYYINDIVFVENVNNIINIEELFFPYYFIKTFTQYGINKYNKKIGVINKAINLTKQKLSGEKNNFPIFEILYKQILADEEKTVIMDKFENIKEVKEAINEFQKQFDKKIITRSNELDGIVECFENKKDEIFFDRKYIRQISNELLGNWNKIDDYYALSLAKKVEKKEITQKELTKELKIKFLPLKDIEFFIKEIDKTKNYTDYFKQKLQDVLTEIKEPCNNLDDRVFRYYKKTENITRIKDVLNNYLTFFHIIKNITSKNTNEEFKILISKLINISNVTSLYDKIRNFLTKKEYSLDKIKLNFDCSSLLSGWDENKEKDNLSSILTKDGLYYLAIFNKKHKNVFDYDNISEEEENFNKMSYKFIGGASKQLPRIFFPKKDKKEFRPNEELKKINAEKLYKKENIKKHGKENLHKYIDYCKECLLKYKWDTYFNFSFKNTEDYDSIDQFYYDVDIQGYKITFDKKIGKNYIEEKIERGELFLFQIYNKDFSTNKKKEGDRNAKDNLHTKYFKLLFSEENLKNIVFKLNGKGEVFFRQRSIEHKEEIIKKGHHYKNLKDKFSYPIIKDKRFTIDKFFFHISITLNFKSKKDKDFNQEMNDFLKNNKDVNIIGIDRGEKHLLYYSVINQEGKILEQGSLNTISNIDRNEKEHKKDYNLLLAEKSKSRDSAKKSWQGIEDIKNLKNGYMSHIIHKIYNLIIDYNAIVVLEDLNFGFKRGRQKIEKQVYQKFEKALIDKLNYLVLKNRSENDIGGYLKAYQLTNKYIGKQSGILFYTNPNYTSITDPITGFAKNIYYNYTNINSAQKFWKSFDQIYFDGKNFIFKYSLNKIITIKNEKTIDDKLPNKKTWEVSSVVDRSCYNSKEKETELIENLTDRIKELFSEENINVLSLIKKDLKDEIVNINNAKFHKKLIWFFNLILNIRVTDAKIKTGEDENDYIFSPVFPFYNSKDHTKYPNMPKNSDSNGAYNISRKGLLILAKINEGSKKILISNKDWFDFVQKENH